MKKLFSSSNIGDITMFKTVLEEAGIPYEVRNQSSPYPLLNFFPEVWVLDDLDYPKAQELRNDFCKAQAEEEKPWVCPACGERLEGTFASCWKCGTARRNTT